MKKAIIFDLDGTLINSLPDISAAMNRALKSYQLPVYDEEAYKYMIGDGVVNLARRAVGDHQERMEHVLYAYRADYAQNSRVNTHPYPGISEMLEALANTNLLLCVFSNKDMMDTISVVKHYFPHIPFAAIRGKTEDMPIKPDPLGALKIASDLGVLPNECWYVGDTNTDMKCGNNAGMESVGVLWGFRKEDELLSCGARHIAPTPQALLNILLEKA
ncbi:MAG: HAD family hydrolase [Clostridiales bacterium]|nr:HAD family hydrolase [Clostridiales bacterium]